MHARLICFAFAAAACGAGAGKAGTTPANRRGIESAALPYQILDARNGHEIPTDAFWAKLATERAICVGEEHKNPHHHWVELEVVRRMMKQWPRPALGMEMFQRPFQGVLDDFAAKRIDAEAMRSRAGWADRWGYDYNFYGPTIDAAVSAHAALVALNAARELTKKVVHHGLESLTPDEKAQVPELVLDDKAHRAWFDALMEDMGGESGSAHSPHAKAEPHDEKDAKVPHDEKDAKPPTDADHEMPSADRIYTVQVIWDETMADTAAKWLAANPDGRIVILAGSGHCHDSAIVNRMKRRGITEVVSIHSVIDDGQGGVAEALAKPMNDFLFVLELPDEVKKQLAEENK